jgi:hypothetical protein
VNPYTEAVKHGGRGFIVWRPGLEPAWEPALDLRTVPDGTQAVCCLTLTRTAQLDGLARALTEET